MSDLNQTPRGNRVHIAFFGLRNAGKSTLVNAFCGQDVAIVSDVPGTTTDPVSKSMEILPLGPCMITDTAGLDDTGDLGSMRVKRTLDVLATVDIAVWVSACPEGQEKREALWRDSFDEACRDRKVKVYVYRRGDDVEQLKSRIADAWLEEKTPGLLDGLVKPGDAVTCVCPIDSSAPKGRLILPQVQVIRECLDLHATCKVVQPEEFVDDGGLVIVDSQAVSRVKAKRLTTFSVLFARQKGDFAEFKRGIDAVRSLKDGDTVLISEACTHRRHCEDIGSTKIPKAVMALAKCQKLNFAFSSGSKFNPETMRSLGTHASLIVHCGACMLTRRELQHRISLAKAAKVPIVNYGILLSAVAGLTNVDENGIISA